jgi:anti-sigma regulatory factor (Ser/Thr protein kinase)
MTLRPVTVEDCGVISDVAERSFQASYSLSPDQIAVLLEEEFSEAALTTRIEDETWLVVVADDGRTVCGFVDPDRASGTICWLHVDPLERGNGVGTGLAERAMQQLSGREPVTARILETATE